MEYSIGELIDKLVIEEIKIYRIRERLNTEKLSNKDRVDLNNRMMTLNSNRTLLVRAIDAKMDKIVSGEKNSSMEIVRTYGK